MIQVGILGAGFSGRAIARLFLEHNHNIWGTTRHEENLITLGKEGVSAVLFDGKKFSDTLINHFSTTTHLIISISPSREGDPTLQVLGQKNLFPQLQWIGYLSTVGVYGNHNGAWVDEETPPAPVSQRSKQRVLAEDAWQKWATQTKIPLSIFRLSGIYGKGRNALCNAKSGKARRLIKEGQIFNRVHTTDIAQAVFLAAQKKVDGIFNITDNEPSPPQDVVSFAHDLMGIEPPPPQDFLTAQISEMARSFYGENKRVSNGKSKTILSLKYQYPDYRTSLRQMWEQDIW